MPSASTIQLTNYLMTILTEPALYVMDLKPIEAALKKSALDPATLCTVITDVDLTGATIIAWCFTRISDGVAIGRTAAVVDATTGHIRYTFVAGDYTADFVPGTYKVAVRAVLADGTDFVTEPRCCPSLTVLADPCGR